MSEDAEDQAITVWKDGTYKQWRTADAYYAENDPDWFLTISLPVEDDDG